MSKIKTTTLIIIIVSAVIVGLAGSLWAENTGTVSATQDKSSLPYDPNYIDKYVFKDWNTWTNSQYLSDDKMINIIFGLYRNGSVGTNISYAGWADLTGDSLPEFLYYYDNEQFNTLKKIDAAVFLNQGANNLALAYKCVYRNNLWYGDCAGNGRRNTPSVFSWPADNLPTSTQVKAADLMIHAGYLFAQSGNMITVQFGSGNGQATFSDMDGDGLVDFVYSEYWWNNNLNLITVNPKIIILRNLGNLKFEPMYECHHEATSSPEVWKGDCAQL